MKQEIELWTLYRVQKKDLKKCADVAARAMYDDNTSKYYFSKKLTYQKLYFLYLTTFFAIYDQGYLFSPTNKIEGVIAVTPPGKESPKPWTFLRNGGFLFPFKTGLFTLAKCISYETNNMRIRSKAYPKKCWTVFQFSVAPEYQGLGYGSQIIRSFLSWLDEQQLPCYLETHKKRNVKMYLHYGFKLINTDTLPDHKEVQYALARF